VWRVRRRWFRRLRRDDSPGSDGGDDDDSGGSFFDFLPADSAIAESFLVGVVALLVVVLILLFLSLAFLVLEAIVLAAAAFLLGRPWTIEAETEGPPSRRLVWRVRGWHASRRAVEEVAAQLRGGLAVSPRAAEPE
jgi:hypothetical protein